MGRRRSVAETIERRFPSARGRPGAGYLPILAPGRPRDQSQLGVDELMTLWRRVPREVYRVYGQDEYLAGDDQAPAQPSSSATPVEYERGSRSGRLVGLGALVGVSVGALGLVLTHASSRAPAARSSGIAQSARPSAGGQPDARREPTFRRASVGSRAHADATIGAYPALSPSSHPAVPRRRALSRALSSSALPHARSGRLPSKPLSSAVSSARSTPSLAVELSHGQLATPELSASGASLSPVAGEFEFER